MEVRDSDRRFQSVGEFFEDDEGPGHLSFSMIRLQGTDNPVLFGQT